MPETTGEHEFKVSPSLKALKNWWTFETVTTQSKPTAITGDKQNTDP